MQEETPSRAYCPVLQALQVLAPVPLLEVPAGHSPVQSAVLRPVVLPNLPAAQLVQLAEPLTALQSKDKRFG